VATGRKCNLTEFLRKSMGLKVMGSATITGDDNSLAGGYDQNFGCNWEAEIYASSSS